MLLLSLKAIKHFRKISKVGIPPKTNPLHLLGVFIFNHSKNLLYFSLFLFSCTSQSLDGNWNLQLHE